MRRNARCLDTQMAAYSHRIRPADARLEGHARLFVNAQWAIGGAGTGAPVHYHNTAWNALVYGAKLWYIYPPAERIMSNDQVSLLRYSSNLSLAPHPACFPTYCRRSWRSS